MTIAPIEETVDEILEFIREFYQRMDSGLDIENELYKLFDELKEDLWTLIEYPYWIKCTGIVIIPILLQNIMLTQWTVSGYLSLPVK